VEVAWRIVVFMVGLLVERHPSLRAVFPIKSETRLFSPIRQSVEIPIKNRQKFQKHFPSQDPMPGEGDLLRTFAREWLDYEWDG